MIFVDTSAWFALFASADPRHLYAVRLIQSSAGRLITTDYVVDETPTLLKAKRALERALVFGAEIQRGDLARLHFVSQDDFIKGWSIFQRNRDKGWSFTDCVSFAVMKQVGSRQAIAFDEHFQQVGEIAVLE